MLVDSTSNLWYSQSMDRKLKGRLAEAKAAAWFVENEYEVYLPMHDNTGVDMVVIKDGITERVSVKYTSERENQKWRVTLSNVSRRKDNENAVSPFNSDSVDLLAVYIGPEDRVVIRKTDFAAKYALAVS